MESAKIEDIERLVRLFDESKSTSLKLKTEEFQISLSKGFSGNEQPAPPSIVPQQVTTQSAVVPAKEEAGQDYHVITAPLVGTFYRSPSPEAAAFIKVGDVVNKGDTICIIEAMKLLNEIEADESGEVMEIYAENANLVEFGAKLISIKKS